MTARRRQTPKSDETEQTVDSTAVEEPTTEPATGAALVQAGDPNSLFRVLDRHDEELVEAEIKGELLATMAYEFSVSGKQVRGLSYAGVNSAVRVMNARGVGRIKCPPFPEPKFEEITDEDGDSAWRCTVYAVDELVGGGAWGTASQKKVIVKRNGEKVPDTFSRSKALSKAQRNAKSALIPEGLKAQMLAALSGNQVRTVGTQTAADHQAQQPRVDTSAEAKQLDQENEALLAELTKLGLKPAKVRELRNSARTLEEKRGLQQQLNTLLARARARAGAD